MNTLSCRSKPVARRFGFFFLLLLVLAWPGVSSALSGTCALTPGFQPYTINMPLSGSVTVGRDLPIGRVIYRQMFTTTTPHVSVTCQPGDYVLRSEITSPPYPLSSYVSPNFGAKVYNTNIPGIGVAFTSSDNSNWAFPIDNNARTYTSTTTIGNTPGIWGYLILIKTANTVGSGTITSASLPTGRTSMVGSNLTPMHYITFSGSVNVVARTCTTPDVSVPLGNHVLNEISGAGSTTSWVSVPVRLNNCPAFFGRTDNMTYDTGQTDRSLLFSNTIQYRVDPTTAIVNAAQSVMALKPDGVNPTATNIGIQMGDPSGNPVGFGTAKDSGLALTQTDGASYTINLRARYYQTAANPTAGQANGAATITLTYQ